LREVRAVDPILQRLDEIEERLRARAFLYDDPACYRLGIEAALKTMREQLELHDALAV